MTGLKERFHGGEGSEDGLEGSTQQEASSGRAGAARRTRQQGQRHRRRTNLPRHKRSGVRVGHDRFGVVVGEWVIQPGLDDPFGNFRRCPCRRHAHALLPQAQMAEDALDHVAVVDQGHDAHFFLALRAEKWVRFPHLLDELAPLGRGDAAGLMLRHIDDLDGLARGFGLFGGALIALATHLIRIPAVVAHELETLVRDVLGDGGDKVAGGEDLEVALNLRVEARVVDHGPVRVGPVRGADLHLLHGEGIADDVLGQTFQVFTLVGQHAPAAVYVEPGVDPAA